MSNDSENENGGFLDRVACCLAFMSKDRAHFDELAQFASGLTNSNPSDSRVPPIGVHSDAHLKEMLLMGDALIVPVMQGIREGIRIIKHMNCTKTTTTNDRHLPLVFGNDSGGKTIREVFDMTMQLYDKMKCFEGMAPFPSFAGKSLPAPWTALPAPWVTVRVNFVVLKFAIKIIAMASRARERANSPGGAAAEAAISRHYDCAKRQRR